MRLTLVRAIAGSTLCFMLGAAANAAQMPIPPDAEDVLAAAFTGKSYSPYVGRQTALMPLWGDSHLHTDISMDAGAFG
ncbi:MAG: hypothetical protein O7E52_16610, partial [Candidatus Poribacteria bacterium]|nr:hypothetical protein [Candidatus Poribacteria bacterium]